MVIDNFAVAHRAAAEAHTSPAKVGLRILHRTTVKAVADFKPPFGLPQGADVYAPNPLNADGVWMCCAACLSCVGRAVQFYDCPGVCPRIAQGGGIGFRWDSEIHMQN